MSSTNTPPLRAAKRLQTSACARIALSLDGAGENGDISCQEMETRDIIASTERNEND